MMIGQYPCCNEWFMLALPDKLPVYWPEKCPHCGEEVWHKLSKVDPTTWLKADFEKEFRIDYDSKIISPIAKDKK